MEAVNRYTHEGGDDAGTLGHGCLLGYYQLISLQ
jgi:hypothetical protein